ncbi:lauroyl acyltransferase [Luteimonas sp. MC1825]|uniref:lauroyl acyltransferase n=1 Tax=Luteimonas sp. MC1825 TaxID=2761107 RepID=UPI0016200E2E|nr:lauroyl acyltransferase [Luteimonas sp. MC1825]MBB6600339.1 lauroyl acyltransferase [Luteimonas sp. MC1825]QOC88017.1 lauroyl acyltransferase [Luteimonas sp. MC1825]
MTEFLASLLHALATMIGRLPWPLQRALGDGLGRLVRAAGVRESVVALRNLELAYPDMPAAERAALHAEVIRTTGRQAFETLRLWTRPHAENLALIREQSGVELFEDALAAGRGVIVVAPHHGNWELLNQWLAARTPLAILYKAPESAVGEAFLRRVRADADQVTQVRAEGPGIRQLFKVLKAGGVVGILPDQQPKAGDGVFAPFFGIQALTMTLVSRLAERSGATVLFASCERIDDDLGFALRFDAASAALSGADIEASVAALNAGVEHMARRAPAQYQWTYKRFTLRPPGSGEGNPYRDLEHGRR